MAITASPVRDADGAIIGAVEVVRNITSKKQAEHEREQLIARLEKALEEINKLHDILPICSHCKNIRNDKGDYEKIEDYLRKHSGVDCSHTICPACFEKHYSEFAEDVDGENL